MEDNIKRLAAKRITTLVIEIVRAKPTVVKHGHPFDLKARTDNQNITVTVSVMALSKTLGHLS